ncbi:grisea protein [Apiospora rasikravindrae]|uniref:Grisea protein n=1 Tax=Apiospora rasikravindrae TaxID=990691 RepID=A0ABR1SJW7_9PEZI
MADQGSRWRNPEDGASRDRHGRPISEKRKRTPSRSPSREIRRRRADDSKERRSHHAHNDTRDRDPHSPSASGRHHHHHHHHRSSHRHHKQRTSSTRAPRVVPTELPYSSRPLSKADYDTFLPLLARYLDIQKGKDIHELDEREVRGRWKSFVGKWNEGSLANGWYDPEYFQEVRQTETPYVAVRSVKQDPEEAAASADTKQQSLSPEPGPGPRSNGNEDEDEDEDDDDYGPRMPDKARRTTTATGRAGPGIPNLQDLDLRREQAEEDKTEQIAQLRLQRKADRAEQKARLEELVPRAEAGTRERQLEKKREVNEKLKSFRERSPGGAAEVVDDKELMGGGDSVAEYKQAKAAAERRKTERELRREEIERARAAEREEKLREYREREEDTMAVFKEIARQRFG